MHDHVGFSLAGSSPRKGFCNLIFCASPETDSDRWTDLVFKCCRIVTFKCKACSHMLQFFCQRLMDWFNFIVQLAVRCPTWWIKQGWRSSRQGMTLLQWVSLTQSLFLPYVRKWNRSLKKIRFLIEWCLLQHTKKRLSKLLWKSLEDLVHLCLSPYFHCFHYLLF